MLRTLNRVVRVLVGVGISSIAFLFIVHANLGTGPWHVVQLGLADQLEIGLGTAVWVSGIALFLAALATGERPGIGTLAAVTLGGVYVNLAAPYVDDVHGIGARVAVLVLATLAMTFGGALYMSADLGASPLDALMTGIYRHTLFSLRVVRIGLECFGLALGWLLGGEVGVGTLFIGLTVGPLLQFWLKVLRAHPSKHVDHALDLDVV